MALFFILLLLSYCLFTIGLMLQWKKIPNYIPGRHSPQTIITIVIPIRNEADNILNLLNDLSSQDYPKELYEVLIIDDASTDKSVEVIQNHTSSMSIKILPLTLSTEGAHKKNAIELGVNHAKGSLILTTDGDCRVGNKWLSTIEDFYKSKKSKLLFGGVTFFQETTFFEKIQTVEFASLTGSGAACLQAGYPNMCNGANLAYEKDVFLEVQGYKDFDHIPSGDDEFLMHKVYNLYPDRVHFIKNADAVVYTRAKRTWSEFYHQRKRWAGKWKYYQFYNIKIIALFIFLSNILLLVAIGMSIGQKLDWYFLIVLFAFKFFPDYYFLNVVLKFYGKKNKLLIFILTAVFYPFYVSFFGISSNIGKYSWKGRNF